MVFFATLPILRASQAPLQLALQADLCTNETSRTPSTSAYIHKARTCIQKCTKTHRPTTTNAARMPAGVWKGPRKNTKWHPCSSFSWELNERVPPFLSQPSILWLSDPSGPSTCTLAKGADIEKWQPVQVQMWLICCIHQGWSPHTKEMDCVGVH